MKGGSLSFLTRTNVKESDIVAGKVVDAFGGAGENDRLTVKVPGYKVDEYRELFNGEGGLNGDSSSKKYSQGKR